MIYEDTTFERKDYTQEPLPKGEYESCSFAACDFSNSDLSGIRFTECEFSDCNLAMTKLINTSFRDVSFKDCKMLGLCFYDCSEFLLSFGFENCVLNHSSFHKLKIGGTLFRDSHLREADFTECDLSLAVFENCDLSRATFERTNLEGADLGSASGYSFDPDLNRIRGALFSTPAVIALLDKYDIRIDE